METKYSTREEWLDAAITELQDSVFQPRGYELPGCELRPSCGFPSSKALPTNSRVRMGECWKQEASESRDTIHIFISPLAQDPVEVLSILSHELIHTIEPEDRHGRKFMKIARAIGLVGPAHATVAGEELKTALGLLANRLGEYPHDKLVPLLATKTQTTRLLKAICPKCGYTIRVTQKWASICLPLCRNTDAHDGSDDYRQMLLETKGEE